MHLLPACLIFCVELEWKVVYVGSAENEKYDQVLDCVLVGPVLVGRNKFVLEVPGPNPKKILNRDILELTVLVRYPTLIQF